MRAFLALCLLAAPPALAECRQSLVLAIDVSASVDQREYRLQSGGLAAALRDIEVRQAFLAQPQAPVALAVFEWSGAAYQRLVLDWTLVEDARVLDAVAARIEANPLPPEQTTTGIGAAMIYAGELLARGPGCAARTLDISGDGQNNDWPRPQDARLDPTLAGVTINGLVIGADFPIDHELNPNRMGALTAYYRNRVIKGPGAFVETARDFEDFGEAMRRKLIRELSTMMIGMAPARSGNPAMAMSDDAVPVPAEPGRRGPVVAGSVAAGPVVAAPVVAAPVVAAPIPAGQIAAGVLVAGH